MDWCCGRSSLVPPHERFRVHLPKGPPRGWGVSFYRGGGLGAREKTSRGSVTLRPAPGSACHRSHTFPIGGRNGGRQRRLAEGRAVYAWEIEPAMAHEVGLAWPHGQPRAQRSGRNLLREIVSSLLRSVRGWWHTTYLWGKHPSVVAWGA